MRKIKRLVMKWFYRICLLLFPVNKKIIIFESNAGRNYTGNPRYIYEEMVRQGLDKKYRIFYVFDDPCIEIPGRALKIKRMRFLYYYAFAVAGTWVCDLRLPNEIVKREGCSYIQTWHGTPLKKLALDLDNVFMEGEEGIEKYKEEFKKNTATWDYLISQNRYSSEIFRRAFDFHGRILEIGYPRNDLLFLKNKEKISLKMKKRLGIPEDKKVMLYAPTWRDDQYFKEGEYKFSSSLDYGLMREEFEDEYCMVAKYHYLVKDSIDWSLYEGFLYSCDMSYDISYLYLMADILITDYSSVMFDYGILGRPMYFFAYDLEDYRDRLRGFYFDFINEAPGPVVTTTKELAAAIKCGTERSFAWGEGLVSAKGYGDRYAAFYERFDSVEKGNASKKTVRLIERSIREKNPKNKNRGRIWKG